jgi:succinyl-diaminopimelate desuccinylase
MNPPTIIAALRRQRESIRNYLCDLIRARTVNPPGDEHLAAAVLERFFITRSIPFDRYEMAPGRTNIIGRIGRGRPCVAVVCHLDVVPAGDGWSTDPFDPVEKDGRIYGRGAKDNKGSLASAIAAMEFLKQHESQLKGQVLLVGAADEERGSRYGTHYLLGEGLLPPLDYALIPDAGDNMTGIDVAEKGLLFLKIVCHGRQAHGSTPDAGVSAILPMCELALQIAAWEMPGGVNELFHPTTATHNVGLISGGSAPNMVAGRCEMQLDIRYLPGTDRDELLAEISRMIDEVESLYPGAYFEVEPTNEEIPTAVATDSRIYTSLAGAVELVTGRAPKPFGIGGVTVAKQFIAAGIPAVGICPGDKGVEHVADESISVDELTDFAAVLALCLWDLAGG